MRKNVSGKFSILSVVVMIIILIYLIVTLLDAIHIGNDMKFNIELIRHSPCQYVKG